MRACPRVRVGGFPACPDCCLHTSGPEPLPPKGLQYLVLLSHAHSRECSLVPGLRGPGGQDGGLVWECSAGHTFSWGPSSGSISPEEPKPASCPNTSQRSCCLEARSGQEPAGRLQERRVTKKSKGEWFPSLWLRAPFSKNDPFSVEKLG